MAKQMKIDPYYQRQKCSPMTPVFLLPNTTTVGFILYSWSAVINSNRAPDRMIAAPKPHSDPGLPVLHFNTCHAYVNVIDCTCV